MKEDEKFWKNRGGVFIPLMKHKSGHKISTRDARFELLYLAPKKQGYVVQQISAYSLSTDTRQPSHCHRWHSKKRSIHRYTFRTNNKLQRPSTMINLRCENNRRIQLLPDMGNPDPLAGPFGCKPCNPRLDASPIYMTHSIINLNWSKICQICLVFTDLVIVAIFVGFSVPGFRVENFFCVLLMSWR